MFFDGEESCGLVAYEDRPEAGIAVVELLTYVWIDRKTLSLQR